MDWGALADKADAIIDELLGEPIQFIPWNKDVGGGFTEGQEDNTRSIPDAVGCYVSPAARVEQPGGQFTGRQVEADMMFSLRDDYVGSLKEHDRVYLPRRDETFEVVMIAPGDTDRSVLHLVKA